MPAHKGHKHHLAKLNPELVREIRRLRSSGKTLNQIQTALMYMDPPVYIESTTTLDSAAKRQTWRHVT